MLDPKTLYAIENILAKKINSAHRTENIGLLEELTEALKKKRESIEKELKTSGKTFEACQTTTIIEKNRKMTKYKCSWCGGSWTVYRIYFSSHHVNILKKIFMYCVKNRTHILDKKAIKDLTSTDITNFSHLQRFGLLYWITDNDGKKQKGGKWGAAVKRIRAFLGGEWQVAEYSEKDTLTQEQRSSENRILISEIKRYSKQYPKDLETFLPYFISYDADPFDRTGYHSTK